MVLLSFTSPGSSQHTLPFLHYLSLEMLRKGTWLSVLEKLLAFREKSFMQVLTLRGPQTKATGSLHYNGPLPISLSLFHHG